MKMEVNNQLHIDWGRNRDKLLGGKKKSNSASQVAARGVRKNWESGDPLRAVSDTQGVPGQETQLLLSGPSFLRRRRGLDSPAVPKHQPVVSTNSWSHPPRL